MKDNTVLVSEDCCTYAARPHSRENSCKPRCKNYLFEEKTNLKDDDI